MCFMLNGRLPFELVWGRDIQHNVFTQRYTHTHTTDQKWQEYKYKFPFHPVFQSEHTLFPLCVINSPTFTHKLPLPGAGARSQEECGLDRACGRTRLRRWRVVVGVVGRSPIVSAWLTRAQLHKIYCRPRQAGWHQGATIGGLDFKGMSQNAAHADR